MSGELLVDAPMTSPPWPNVTLCIPTFRRPQGLGKLLTHVAQLACFGLAKLNPARDLAVMDVQARNDSFGDHGKRLNRFR